MRQNYIAAAQATYPTEQAQPGHSSKASHLNHPKKPKQQPKHQPKPRKPPRPPRQPKQPSLLLPLSRAFAGLDHNRFRRLAPEHAGLDQSSLASDPKARLHLVAAI